MTVARPAATPGRGPVIVLPTLLQRLAQEQAGLARTLLALQDILSPDAVGAIGRIETIRALQSVDLVTQTLNDLARLTRAIAEGSGHVRLPDPGPQRPDAASPKGPRPGTPAPSAAAPREGPGTQDAPPSACPDGWLLFEIPALRQYLTLGDLSARILGTSDPRIAQETGDVLWLGEPSASARRDGAA